MIAFWILMAAICQNPAPLLEVGGTVQSTLGPDAQPIYTPVLGTEVSDSTVVGVPFRFEVGESGFVHLDLKSFDFDAYLVLYDSDGVVLLEDDDGLINSHSRLVFEAEVGQEYQVMACALFDGRGKFSLQLSSGKPKEYTLSEKWKLEAINFRERISHLEGKGVDKAKDLAFTYTSLGLLLYEYGDLEGAMPLMDKALMICEEVFGPRHENTAVVLVNIGVLLQDIGDYSEARIVFERALSIAEECFGPSDPETAIFLSRLAGLYAAETDFEMAAHFLHRSMEIIESCFGSESVELANEFYEWAYILESQGNLVEALHFSKRACEIEKNHYGANDNKLAHGLNNLGGIYQELGEFRKAQECYHDSLQLMEREYGPIHRNTATLLGNLAFSLQGSGEYNKARVYAERSYEIMESIVGVNHLDTSFCLRALALILRFQGDFEGAFLKAEQALEIREEVLGPNHVTSIYPLIELGSILQEMGRPEQARPLLERALAIGESNSADGVQNLSTAHDHLGEIFLNLGDSERALEHFRKAVNLSEELFGADHPDYAIDLCNLGNALLYLGDHVGARVPLERSVSCLTAAWGDQHPSSVSALGNLAGAFENSGDYGAAYPLHQRALDGMLRYLERELPTLSEAGRLRFLEVSGNPESLLYCLSRMDAPSMLEPYASFSRWKGKATRMQAASIRISSASDLPEIRMKKGRIQVASKELNDLLLMPLAEQSQDHSSMIASLKKERIRLERELNRELGLDQLLAIPDLDAVQSQLPSDSTLIDFFVGDDVYAWVLKPKGEPILISLGDADAILRAQTEFLSANISRGGRAHSLKSPPGAALMKLLWEPLHKHVGEANLVFVSPDDFLCELPLGILPGEHDGYLIEEHQFVYLTDPTRLAADREVSRLQAGAILGVGGVNYFSRGEAGPEVVERGGSSRSGSMGSWISLPATKDEMQYLRDLHQFVLGWESPLTILEGEDATEERVRAELPGNRYVHIATHGYFEPDHFPSLLSDAKEKHAEANLDEQIQAVGLLPGLLSGLVFAGVNAEFDPDRDDGYLSAEEIQHLSLAACDLVVLSACETAMGSARAGEGLMSLRRAFSVAGANTVISSLWKVDDQAAADLMKDFYTNLWQKGMSRGEALHQAKLRQLDRNRSSNGGNALPSTWGAFVLSGAWE